MGWFDYIAHADLTIFACRDRVVLSLWVDVTKGEEHDGSGVAGAGERSLSQVGHGQHWSEERRDDEW